MSGFEKALRLKISVYILTEHNSLDISFVHPISSFESIVLERVAATSDMSEEAISSSCLRSDSTCKCSEKSSQPSIPYFVTLSNADSTILLVTLI